MLQKLLNFLFKKQNFTKDLKEMTADDFISKYFLDKGQTVVRKGLAQELYDSNSKHLEIVGARQTVITLGATFGILYRVLRMSENQRVFIVSYSKYNSKRIMRDIKNILLRKQSNIGFTIEKNNTENFTIYISNKMISFEVISLNQYSMSSCGYDNTILFADEIGYFDKKYYNALIENMNYILGSTKNSLFVSTRLC